MGARFFPGQLLPEPRQGNKPQLRAHVSAGVVRAEEILATVVTLQVLGTAQLRSGFTHDGSIMNDLPGYIQEAAVLHALRILRE